jgi:hypothetical protein
MASKKTGTSKTARASTPSSKKGGFEFDPVSPRVIPLGGKTAPGSYAYVQTLDGRTVHVAVTSATFIELVATLAGIGVAAGRTAEVADKAAASASPELAAIWSTAAKILRGEIDPSATDADADVADAELAAAGT